MLYLKPPYYLIEGVTLFRDHEDPLQWYFLPAAPHLTILEDKASGQRIPQFQLIKYRGRAGNGGFLNFDVNLGVEPETLDEVRRELRSREHLNADPRLSPVLLEDGTVKLMLFGKQSGDVVGPDTPEAQFVLKIDHHAKPALYGNNQAAFSVQLDQEGVTVLEKAMQGEMAPIGVVYALDYLALRPAYNIRLSIDWERVQKHFEEHLGVNSLLFSADIDKITDELIEKRVIVLEADTFVPEGDEEEGVTGRRDQALNQVREMITDAFFTPSLDPFQEKEDGWDKAAGFFERIAQVHANGGHGALFSYKKLDYQRIDKKSLNINISERTTVKRSIYPQGHLSGIFRTLRQEGLDPNRFIIPVDLDDAWFERRRVKVISRVDFAADNIVSVNVNLRYGQQIRSVLLDSTKGSGEVEWASILQNNAMVRAVTVDYTVNFKSSDGAERPMRLQSSPLLIEGDNLEIDPRGDGLYTLNSIPMLTFNFPWLRYPLVEVRTRYNDAENAIRLSDTFLLRENTSEARWQRFMRDPNKSNFLYQVIYHAAAGSDVVGEWLTANEDQILLRDPFPKKRTLTVVPNFRWSEVDRAFVDLLYEDPANELRQEESFEFNIDQNATQTFIVDVADPTLRHISYQVTVLYSDGRVLEVPRSVTLQPRLILSANMRGHRIIEVRPPTAMNFQKKRLKALQVALRYSDASNRLSFQDDFTFSPTSAPEFFEFDYVDPQRLRYSYTLKYTFVNNLTRTIPEQNSMSALLELPTPA